MDAEIVKIVVVDDEQVSAELLCASLKLDGYSAWAAHRGAEALGIIAREHPHCVLLDLCMPGMAGAELAKHIRAQHGSELVLVAITGSTDAAELREAEMAGVDHVLPKPLDLTRLRRILPPIQGA